VSEESARVGSGPEGNGAGVDPTAVALALAGASRTKADAFLDDQRRLIADQRHHLHEQYKRLKMGVISDRLSITLKVLTAVVGIGVASFFSLMVWDAAHSSGLIIEPFAVPADMAARGLTGQVVASQMLDKLTVMQDATDSVRPPQSYENNWGSSLKVEIPETGISIGELQAFLKGWLGHDTHITGEVWRTASGIAVSAREGSEAGVTFSGPENDLDGLMQKAAVHVYSVTQPYRYANFLDRDYGAPDIAARAARATAIYRKLIAGGNAVERGWAWYGLGTIAGRVNNDQRMGSIDFEKSIAANPDSTLGYVALGNYSVAIGHFEKSLAISLKAKSLLDRSTPPNINPRYLALNRLLVAIGIARSTGDFQAMFRSSRLGEDAPEFNAVLTHMTYMQYALQSLAYMHDGGGIRVHLLDLGRPSSYQKNVAYNVSLLVASALQDWPSVLQLEKVMPEGTRQLFNRNAPYTTAIIALAHAHMGDLQKAETLVAQCADDSDHCLIARGKVADMRGQHGRADYWFARAVHDGPSIPFAHEAWGRSLLARGKPDDAIAQFTFAHQKGPHFADPIEDWGEALMAKSQSHLALAKFEEAEKYAPNWGRLHLKWGEALVYAGRKDEAKAQFVRATTLDLTPSEKSELERHP